MLSKYYIIKLKKYKKLSKYIMLSSLRLNSKTLLGKD